MCANSKTPCVSNARLDSPTNKSPLPWGISKGIVIKYVGLAVAAALDWRSVAAMDGEATRERRLLALPRPSDSYAQADYGRSHQGLGRKGVTLMLWEKYRGRKIIMTT
jgi:hypothetical protein